MIKGLHSKGDIKGAVKEGVNEIAAISKEVYEAIESKGTYNSMNLDEQLSNQIQEMNKERERLEKIQQIQDEKEENREIRSSKPKSNVCEHER